MEASLRDMLKHGRKFERMRTDVSGIFVRKLPRVKDEPAHLAIEINPIDQSGNPMYRVGVLIRNQNQLDAIRRLLSLEMVDELLQTIERARPKQAEREI